MQARQYFITTTLITLMLFLAPAGIVIIFDPFFVFHKPLFIKDIGFDGTDRYQNAGLINSWLADPDEKIDTIIVGTSMSQNLPVSTLKNEHGVNAIKLTLGGGKAKELGLLMQKAIETNNVKHVVWEIYTSYAHENSEHTHKGSPLPQFIYNQSRIDDWRYIFNNDVVEEGLKVAIGKKKKRRPLEELYTWENKEQFKKFSSTDNLEIMRNRLRNKALEGSLHIQITSPDKEYSFPNVTENLLPILKKNPSIQFHLFFPPISYYAHAIKGNETFWTQMKMRVFILQQTQDLENVSIHGFDLKEGWGNNLSNYMDPNHYNIEISQYILQAISQDEQILSTRDMHSYTESLAKNINAFVESFARDAPAKPRN